MSERGTRVGRRVLVVNADDFGRSDGINGGVQRAHEDGIVTSATLMVRWPAAARAAVYARRTPSLSVGLHLDLAEWEYTGGEWRPCYEVIDVRDADAVGREIDRQVDAFVDLVGRPPTHLDSHQHVHRDEPVRGALGTVGHRLGVPVRDVTSGVRYRGSFYGQDGRGHPVPDAITVDALVATIADLPVGVTELGCHPGAAVDYESVYAAERARELDALCDARVRDALDEHGVELRSFAALDLVR